MTPHSLAAIPRPDLVDGPAGPTTHSVPLAAAADTLLAHLERGAALDAPILRQAMSAAHGASDADGAWIWKSAYDAAEGAAVLFLLRHGQALQRRAPDTATQLSAVTRLSALLPSQTRRSDDSETFQQFSTPIELALVLVHVARLRRTDLVLEPSAGTGLLAVHAKLAGARLALNELEPARAALLRQLFGCDVTCHDAASIDDRLPSDICPTVVLMNPPFSALANVARGRSEATLLHVRSALARLAPGGRLVALTGDGFAPTNPTWREAFTRLQSEATVQLSVPIAAGAFHRHGTTVATRMTVLDKIPAQNPFSFPACLPAVENAEQLLHVVENELPDRPAESASAGKTAPHGKLATTTPQRTTRRRVDPTAFVRQPTRHPLDQAQHAPLAYTLRVEDTSSAVSQNLYEPYKVQTIEIDGAHPSMHPLVQSGAMASVVPPKPSYRPILPVNLVASGTLCDAQLETITYAGEAHSTHLAGTFIVDEEAGTFVRAADDDTTAVRFRRGYFLGDGTGVGKGRQVAGILVDNWLQGRRRALWISKSDKLIEDAIRDWTALGGRKTDIVPLSGYRQGSDIQLVEGILFATYATLRTEAKGDRKSRIEQVSAWLGPDFDGVVAFDEAHAMANAAGTTGERGEQKASQQGLAGLKLQNALPDARVVYVSATGATQVANLAYASRLGLWATADVPFDKRQDFVAAMEDGGVGAMEVISRDLKALGLYAARSLSYHGVEYETLVHELSPEQITIYDAYANAFQIIHHNLEEALEVSGIVSETDGTLNARAKSAARSAFESNKQRLFNHLLTSMKCPTLIAAIDADLAAGHASVNQIVSTGEALMERRLAHVPVADWQDLDIDITPREYVMDYLVHSFPTQLFEPYTDEDGFLRSRPARDADGSPIQCRAAEGRRDAMLELLGTLPPVNTALDQLLWRFGTDEVAEITGRSRRIIRHPDQRLAVQSRPASVNLAETSAFQSDAKRILVFSEAGGTGRSYHADRAAANQRPRMHNLVEPGWKADAAIQGLGRTHRNNQAQPPRFRLVTTNVKGEKRFVSTIARRLDTLGAITRGQRQTGGQGMFSAADNLEGVFARSALRRFFHQLVRGDIACCSLTTFETLTGLSLFDQDGTVKEAMPPITQFLNRMLALKVDMQNQLFEAFHGVLDGIVAEAEAAGTLDRGVETLTAERFEVKERRPIYTHASGAQTVLLTIAETQRNTVRSLQEALELAHQDDGVLMLNEASGHAAVATRAASWTDDEGRPIPRTRLTRPTRRQTIGGEELAASNWKPATEATFTTAWTAETAAVPEFSTSDLHLASGLLLPIWASLPAHETRVYRLQAHDGEHILGRVVPAGEVTSVLRRLGHDVEITMSGHDIVEAVMEHSETIVLQDRLTLKKTRQMGELRLEVLGCTPSDLTELKRRGATTEIVQWRTRVFAPLATAPDFVAGLVASFPVTERRSARVH